MLAAEKGQAAICRDLVQADADVNATTNDGRTALSFASENQHIDVASTLLSAKAKAKLADDSGNTPLRYALANGQNEMVALLER